MNKSFVSLPTIFGFCIVLLIYITGLYPIIHDAIVTNAPNIDPITYSFLVFVPAAFLIALVVGIFQYALGSRRPYGSG